LNREQKAAAVAEIADAIRESEAVYAVDFRGISVPQAAGLRTELREADATFRVVKNSLTERAADEADAAVLKPLLEGPTALTFVRGDAAVAAKALADFGRATELLAFNGGLMDGGVLDAAQIGAIARLPAREVLYGQFVGTIASPLTGLVRGLNALISGLAIQLGQIAEQGLVGGAAPAAETEAPLPEEPDQDAEPKEESPPVQPDQAEGEDTTDVENDKTAETAEED
jgi:large subunit ribosomal protein L10